MNTWLALLLILRWDVPQACADGKPIENCPVLDYTVERAAGLNTAWSVAGTTVQAQFDVTNNADGCWRVKARAATGTSIPSAPVCYPGGGGPKAPQQNPIGGSL